MITLRKAKEVNYKISKETLVQVAISSCFLNHMNQLKDTNTGSLLAKAQTLLIPQAVKACQNVKQLMFLINLK